ncbi:chemotaxis protein CheW [Aminiphilus sp.]|jgi:purine-binding chemotaxis protein CheW|uniref:chemotaxis protein CheW n=1 Tax=Aminiphilus sp. TaxID=1872488 RepID=UPI001BCE2396|nr:chemotaxis protein CheW [Aminiphilus sp.]
MAAVVDMDVKKRGKEQGESSGRERIILVFELFKENYGLDVNKVREIVRVPPTITRVPKAPHFVRGVINLRGTVIPVMDISQKMGGEPQGINSESRIVVVELEDILFGFLVDAVREVSNITDAQVESADSVESSVDKKYLLGVAKAGDGRLIVLLDLGALFEVSEISEEDGKAK